MLLNIFILLAMLGLLAILLMGLINMGRNDRASQQRSNKFMWLRIAVQFGVILLLLLAFYVKSRSG